MIEQRRLRPDLLDSYLGQYAGFTSRLMALVIDSVIISSTSVAVTWFLSVTATMLQLQTILGSLSRIPGTAALLEILFGPAVTGPIAFLYVVGYYTFFWSLTGQTPGKILLGLRVVNRSGGRLTPWQALLRFLGYILSGLALGAGFLWVLVDDRRQGWHDKLAGTFVVYTWAARPDERFLAAEITQLHVPSDADQANR